MSSFKTPHHIYLFQMRNGKKKLAYGESAEDAYENLRLRLNEQEMSVIDKSPGRLFQTEGVGNAFGDRLDLDADPSASHMPVLLELGNDGLGL